MTRILQTIDFLSDARGGPGTVALELHSALSDLGNECKIMTVGSDTSVKPEDHSIFKDEAETILGGHAFSWRYLRRLLSLSQEVDFIVIHGVYSFTTIASLFCATSRRKPYVLIPHGSLKKEAERHPLLKRVADCVFVRRLIRNAMSVFFASEKERRECRIEVPFAHSQVTPFGVSVEAANGSASKTTDGVLRVVFLGRVARVKRVDTLVRAVAQTSLRRQIRCQIIGPIEPIVGTSLTNLVRQMGASDSIQFVGPIPRREVTAALVKSDLLILSSESENFGLAAVEALAAGLGIVVTEQVGMLEFVSDSSIVESFPVGDSMALADILIRCDIDTNARRERRRTAQRLAGEVFSWKAYASHLLMVMKAQEPPTESTLS
jgi:glycosyltransferase involved in cell wall biosynthesis